jgi:NDP-sugar pyrophosphorylase family protein
MSTILTYEIKLKNWNLIDMMNIIVPIAGKSIYFEDGNFVYPKPLIEISGQIMLNYVVDYLTIIDGTKRFIFIINKADAEKYHLNNTIKLLAGEDSVIIQQREETQGAICSILLAIEFIDENEEMVISNGDQMIDYNINDILKFFRDNNADAGTICFESVHPKWSYVKEDKQRPGNIVEVAEKNPISKNAIAGFYYFRKGSFFLNAAMKVIEKNDRVNDLFYVSHTLNELILNNMKLLFYKISNEKYHSFYSHQKIKEYEHVKNKI